MDSIEKISWLTFAILHLNGILDSVTTWMDGREPSMAEYSYADRLTLGIGFFVRNREHIVLHGDYVQLVRAVDNLSREHAAFIAGGCQDDTSAMRDEVCRVIDGLADVLDGIGYPAKVAAKLRSLADPGWLSTGTPPTPAPPPPGSRT